MVNIVDNDSKIVIEIDGGYEDFCKIKNALYSVIQEASLSNHFQINGEILYQYMNLLESMEFTQDQIRKIVES